METVVVRAETQEAEREDVVAVTLEGASWQLNVRASPTDWKRLPEVLATDWSQRRAVRLGTLEGVGVWWHVSGSTLHVSVGEGGPESSDLRLVLPVAVLRHVQEEVAAADEGA